jgi:hypothetical protein
MPSFQGQTDQVLRIELTSILVRVAWVGDKVAAGGEAVIECLTAYVGNGAEIQITVKGDDGATVATVKGTVHANVHRGPVKIPADCKAKSLIAEVELPKHGLKGASAPLKVVPAIQIQNLRWLDTDGAVLTSLGNETNAVCEAQIIGAEAGQGAGESIPQARIEVYQTRGEHGRVLLMQNDVPVEGGKAKLTWRHGDTPGVEKIKRQHDLDKEGGHYHAPEYVFVVAILGARAESEAIQHESFIAYDFGPVVGSASRTAIFEMADGEKREEAVPANGQLRLSGVKPGTVVFKGFKAA